MIKRIKYLEGTNAKFIIKVINLEIMKPPKPKSNVHSQIFSSALGKPRSWAATGETLEKPWTPCSTTQSPLGSGAPGQRNLGLAC